LRIYKPLNEHSSVTKYGVISHAGRSAAGPTKDVFRCCNFMATVSTK